MSYRLIGLLLLLVTVGGCSTFSSPAEKPPAELEELAQSLPLAIKWSENVGNGTDEQDLRLTAAYFENIVFAADRNGLVKAFEADSGKTLWEKETEASLSGGPAADDDIVVVGTNDGQLIALSALTGDEQWRQAVGSEVLSVPAIGFGVAVVHTNDGKIVALEAKTGRQVWVYESTQPTLALRGAGTPVLTQGGILVGLDEGKLAALAPNDGMPLWETTITIPRGRSELERMVDIDATPIARDGAIFVNTYQGDVAGVVQENGVIAWRRELSSHQNMSLDEKALYVTGSDDSVWAIDSRNGASLWKQTKLARRKLTGPVTFGDYVAVGDFEGWLHFLSTEDGSLVGRVKIDSTRITQAPINVNGTLYTYSDGGTLAAITLAAE